MSRAAPSKARMNSRPIALRLASGSVTPASAARNCRLASTTTSSTPVAATKSFSTCSASPARSSPWSTKTQVSWSPTARCTSAAATEESTPPDSPQMTRASPTWARTAATRSSTTPAVVQFGAIRAPRVRKFSITRCPYAECTTSGCHCTPYSRRSSSSNAATGEPADSPVTRKPSGARCTASPWLIQTDCSLRLAVEQRRAVRLHRRDGAAVLAQAGLRDVAAERQGHGLEAVADAEHGDAGREQRRVDRRARPRRTRCSGRRTGSPRRGRGRAARPPAGCAGRSRCRRWPRGPGGRSAGRTGRRSRRRGPGGPGPRASASGSACPSRAQARAARPARPGSASSPGARR